MSGIYTLGGFSLEAGTWADWFSGTMSFAAVATALLGYWSVNKQRAADQNERDRRAAESVGWKAVQVYNDTANIAKYLKRCLESAPKTEYQAMKFSRVRPLGVPPEPAANLAPDEVSLLLKAKASDILMDLSDCLRRYDSIRVAMQEYKSRHEALFELMPRPVQNDGPLFTHILDTGERDRVLPYAMMLDHLLDGIIELLREGTTEAQSILDRYGPAMKAHFGKWNLAFAGNPDDVDLSKV